MKNIILLALVLSVTILSGCGGKKPEPVMIKRPGDETKNCELLKYDIENIEFEIHKLLPETKGKTLKNVGYGVAGFYTFFIPWLLIDFNNAEAKEYEALRQRHDYLAGLAMDKGCNITPQQYPSLDEVKKDYELFKKTESNPQSLETDMVEPMTQEPAATGEKIYGRPVH